VCLNSRPCLNTQELFVLIGLAHGSQKALGRLAGLAASWKDGCGRGFGGADTVRRDMEDGLRLGTYSMYD
jgi:hypothetical protein